MTCLRSETSAAALFIGKARHAKVNKFNVAIGSHHYIVWFDVAVNNARVMRVRQGRKNFLNKNNTARGGWAVGFHPHVQRHAADEFHN